MDFSPLILLIEDEENLRNTIRLNLELEGYNVITCADGNDVLEVFNKHHFHLIILDIMLPNIDGVTLCIEIRKQNSTVPVLFLSAKGTGQDKVAGLKAGADDYLSKPFVLEEFLLRVKNLIYRYANIKYAALADQYCFGENCLNFNTYNAVNFNKEEINLSKKEVHLLKLLISKEGAVVSRDEIMQEVWGGDSASNARTIDNFVLNFRKYFEKNSKNPEHFFSIRGVGYKFVK